MTKRIAAQWCSAIIGAIGVECVFMFAIAKPMGVRFGERKVLVVGMMILGFAQVFSMPFAGPPVVERPTNASLDAMDWSWAETYDGHGDTREFGEQAFYTGMGYELGNTTPSHPNKTQACNMEWCYTIPKLPFGQYFFATVFLQSAFPLANVMLFSLYSKVLGPRSQGLWMGLLNSSGSAARMMGPIAIMQLFVHVGLRWMYAMVAMFLFGTGMLGICYYDRLIVHVQQRGEQPTTWNPSFKGPGRTDSRAPSRNNSEEDITSGASSA
jgi:ceroid-lipofuscinosis MFS transporter 7